MNNKKVFCSAKMLGFHTGSEKFLDFKRKNIYISYPTLNIDEKKKRIKQKNKKTFFKASLILLFCLVGNDLGKDA
jgi:hypothetical protein